MDDVTNPQYFADGGNYGPNAERAVSNAWRSDAWYWLRSPGIDRTMAALVTEDGIVDIDRVDFSYAVRPALKINLSYSENFSDSNGAADEKSLVGSELQNALLGTWVAEDGAEFTFSGDGTVVARFNEDTADGTYSTGGNMLSITIQARTEYAEFNISGNKLVLIERGRREIVVLTRK